MTKRPTRSSLDLLNYEGYQKDTLTPAGHEMTGGHNTSPVRLDNERYKKDQRGHADRRENEQKRNEGDHTDSGDNEPKSKEGQSALQNLIDEDESPTGEQWTVDEIKTIVTAKNLCTCDDPISTSFQVHQKLRTLADTNTENTKLLNNLADQTEDFTVQLIDQVNDKEELLIRDQPEHVDRYASMLSDMTDSAITYSQKKFVAHPLLFKRLEMRWNLGLPEAFKPQKKFRPLLFLLILIDTVLTPILLPIIAYAFYRDQVKRREMMGEMRDNTKGNDEFEQRSSPDKKPAQDYLDRYLNYYTTSLVIFVKDKLSQLVFIAFHFRVCILASTVDPLIEEYFIFIFFTGLVVNEIQQYKESPGKYFKDMWNYLDVITLLIYFLIVVLRIVTIARGGDPYHNRLLEIVNYLYGVNTMLLVLRFSSILELSSVIGPLQIALFQMLLDLLIILVQFFFVITAFSVAITKIYVAEMSYLTPTYNQTENTMAQYDMYCEQGAFDCLLKTSRQLIWSVFGMTDLAQMETHTGLTSDIVAVLFLVFLVLSVIMLVNMLVALLTNTYDNVTTNAEVEWKFARAVVESQYRNLHSILVPFNLLSVPMELIYFGCMGNARKEHAKERRVNYRTFYHQRLFPKIVERYMKKYGGSFPLSIEEKIDRIMDKLQISNSDESTSEKQDQDNLGDLKGNDNQSENMKYSMNGGGIENLGFV